MDEKNDTVPKIIHPVELILQGTYTRSFSSFIPMKMYGTNIHNLTILQDNIGMYNFFLGGISLPWKQVQTQHYMSIQSRRSAVSWSYQSILQIYFFTHSIWTKFCKLIHETDTDRMDAMEHEKLNEAIAEQYMMCPEGVWKYHRNMFHNILDDML